MPSTDNKELSVVFETHIKNTIPEQLAKIGKQAEKSAQKAFENVSKKIQGSVEKPFENAQESINKTLEKVKEPKSFKVADNAIDLMEQKLGNLGAQIAEVERKIASASAQLQNIGEQDGFNSEGALKLESELTGLEAKLISLQSSAISTQEKVNKAVEAPVKAAEKAAEKAAQARIKAEERVRKAIEKTSRTSSKASNKMTKSMGNAFGKLGKAIKGSLKAVFVTAVLYKFFKAFKDHISGAMSKNKEFAKSLNAIKANLSVAFTPIIEAVMPLITRLAQGLATVTKYIATFIAAIFGKTYKQAVNSTKKLQGEAKKAQASTSRDFDELHNVDKDDSGSDSSGTDFSALDTSQLNTGPMQKFQEILEKIRGTVEKVSPAFKNFYEKGIKPVVQWLGGKLKDAFQFLGKQLSKVGDWFVEHKESFSKLGDSLGRLWNLIEPFLNAAWDNLKILMGGIFDGFLSSAGSILDVLPNVIDFVTALFTGDWETLKEKGKEIVEGWWNGIKERWEIIKETASSLFSRFIDLVKEIFGIHSPSTVFSDIGKNLIQGLIDGIKNIWENLISTVTEKLGRLKTLVTEKFISVKDSALEAFDKFKTGLKEKCNGIWSSLKEFINKVLGGVENMINKPVNALNKLIRKLNSLNINVPEVLGGGTIGFNIGEFSQVSISKLARGGLVSKPTLSLIGEAGKEAVLPLEHNTGWMDGIKEIIINAILTAMRMNESSQRNIQSQSQPTDLVFNIDGKTFARIIFDLIAQYGSSKDLSLGVW